MEFFNDELFYIGTGGHVDVGKSTGKGKGKDASSGEGGCMNVA